MTKKLDDLFNEVVSNVRNDRRKVEQVRDGLMEVVSTSDSETASYFTIAESIAKLSDVLTKMNSQLVELTRVAAKVEKKNDGDADKESIFDEIESSEPDRISNDKEEDFN